MKIETDQHPVVLAIGGHDPGGGAGIQADIESIGANGCHATTAITCLTVQDSCDVKQIIPVSKEILNAQCESVLQDCPVAAIKIGLLGSVQAAETVIKLLRNHPHIPTIFDPVLAAGGGTDLTSQELLDIIRHQLLPLCDLITPNTLESARLAEGEDKVSSDAHALSLFSMGTRAVLVTGSHDLSDPKQVIHRLYQPGIEPFISTWPRLSGEYHGSGCTLAAALAARVSLGESLETATHQALAYSWKCLKTGFRSGRCQSLPNRWHQTIHSPHQQ
jgi:hydroxymethylpyrimidine/phosphomethylpyrimidine kinase